MTDNMARISMTIKANSSAKVALKPMLPARSSCMPEMVLKLISERVEILLFTRENVAFLENVTEWKLALGSNHVFIHSETEH